jgi:hypothetical protein
MATWRPDRAFFANRWTRVGLVLMAVGWTPLWGIVLLAKLGIWPDPNPNPVGPGMLFFLTAWPAVVCVVVGAVKSRREQANPPGR